MGKLFTRKTSISVSSFLFFQIYLLLFKVFLSFLPSYLLYSYSHSISCTSVCYIVIYKLSTLSIVHMHLCMIHSISCTYVWYIVIYKLSTLSIVHMHICMIHSISCTYVRYIVIYKLSTLSIVHMHICMIHSILECEHFISLIRHVSQNTMHNYMCSKFNVTLRDHTSDIHFAYKKLLSKPRKADNESEERIC